MSILTDLKAALEAKLRAALRMRMAFEAGEPFMRLRIDYDASWKALERLLTDDTIAALVAVAYAVCDYLQDTCGECATRFCEGDSDIGCSLDDMRAALAPLVKERRS